MVFVRYWSSFDCQFLALYEAVTSSTAQKELLVGIPSIIICSIRFYFDRHLLLRFVE